jgi:hypothetical protein
MISLALSVRPSLSRMAARTRSETEKRGFWAHALLGSLAACSKSAHAKISQGRGCIASGRVASRPATMRLRLLQKHREPRVCLSTAWAARRIWHGCRMCRICRCVSSSRSRRCQCNFSGECRHCSKWNSATAPCCMLRGTAIRLLYNPFNWEAAQRKQSHHVAVSDLRSPTDTPMLLSPGITARLCFGALDADQERDGRHCACRADRAHPARSRLDVGAGAGRERRLARVLRVHLVLLPRIGVIVPYRAVGAGETSRIRGGVGFSSACVAQSNRHLS